METNKAHIKSPISFFLSRLIFPLLACIQRGQLLILALFFALFSPVGAVFAQTNTYHIYLDTDENPLTGCSVTLTDAAGSIAHTGVDYSLNIAADEQTGAVTLSRCVAGNFEAPVTVDANLYPLTVTTAGADYIDHLETALPLNLLASSTKISLALSSRGDYLATSTGASAGIPGGGNGPILINPSDNGIKALPIPLLTPLAYLLLCLLLAGLAWRHRQTRSALVCLLLVGGITLVWAATRIHIEDGSIADWAGITPVATDPAGDNATGTPDLLALYAVYEEDHLKFRIDVNSGRTTAPGGGVTPPTSDSLTFSTTAAQLLTAGQNWGLALSALTANGGVATVTLQRDARTPAALSSTGNNPLTLNWTPAESDVGSYAVTVTATDSEGHTLTQSLLLSVVSAATLPADPGTLAPPLTAGLTPFHEATEFLYSGVNPIQRGIDAGTIDPQRAAVLRGKVSDRAGNALSGVKIQILNHPEYGYTLTRTDGWYDLAVNGGGLLVVDYTKPGHLHAQRKIDVPWRDYAIPEDVVLIQLDAKATPITLNHNSWQRADGTPTHDERGQRTATVFFPPNTQATLEFPDGSTRPLERLTFRATEYTVGDSGPEAMPGELPISVGYTYAVELSADEAIAAGASHIRFNQRIPAYLDNFLEFPVGIIVPVGWYDYQRAAWIGDENGRVIKIRAITEGKAILQVSEEDRIATAAELLELGITEEEQKQLAKRYAVGKTLWRTTAEHFSPRDWNLPNGPPTDADNPPDPKKPKSDECQDGEDCACKAGCEIYPYNRSAGQRIAIPGSPFELAYRSSRAPKAYVIPLTKKDKPVPASLIKIKARVDVAGRRFEREFLKAHITPGMEWLFMWDGRDAYGRLLYAGAKAKFKVALIYPVIIYPSSWHAGSAFAAVRARSGGGVSFGYLEDTDEMEFGKKWEDLLQPMSPDVMLSGAGGWALGGLKFYDAEKKALHTGGGVPRSGQTLSWQFKPVATLPKKVTDTITGPDGALYAVLDWRQIVRIGRDGSQTVIAGNGGFGFSGDGGSALGAQLSAPSQLNFALDGSLYFLDQNGKSIRKIDPAGKIHTVAGLSPARPDVEPLRAQLMALDRDGNLFFTRTDSGLQKRLYQISTNGEQHIVIDLDNTISSLVANPDGGLWIAERERILHINPGGQMLHVAGEPWVTTQADPSEDGDALTQRIRPSELQTDHAGGVYFIDQNGNRFRRLSGAGVSTIRADTPMTEKWLVMADEHIWRINGTRLERLQNELPEFGAKSYAIARDNGILIDRFDQYGRQSEIRNGLTDAVALTLQYNAAGYPILAKDADGNTVTFERNGQGQLTAIVGNNGERTTLSYHDTGMLASVTTPGGITHKMDYETHENRTGLMNTYTDPNGHHDYFVYNKDGDLTRNLNPAGGGWQLESAEIKQGSHTLEATTLTSAEGRVTVYQRGGYGRKVTHADGLVSIWQGWRKTLPDGSWISTSKSPDPRYGMLAGTQNLAFGMDGTGTTYFSIGTQRNYGAGNWSETTTIDNSSAYTTAYKNGKLTYTTPVGLAWTATVDDQLRPHRLTPTGLAAIDYTYDPRGRLTGLGSSGDSGNGTQTRSVTASYAPDGGQLASLTDTLGRSSTYHYDAAGRLTNATLPDGRSLGYQFDANGNLIGLTTPAGITHRFSYDAINQPGTYTAPASTTQWHYNLDRELTRITRPGGQSLNFTYDAGGRLTGLTTPEGDTTWLYNDKGQLEQTSNNDATLTYTRTGTLTTGSIWNGAINGVFRVNIANSKRLLPSQHIIESGADKHILKLNFDGADRLTAIGLDKNKALPTPLALGYGTQGALTGLSVKDYASTWQYNDFGETIAALHTSPAVLTNHPEEEALRIAVIAKVHALEAALLAEIDTLGSCRRQGWNVPNDDYEGGWTYTDTLNEAQQTEHTEKYGAPAYQVPDACSTWVNKKVTQIIDLVAYGHGAGWTKDIATLLNELESKAGGGAAALTYYRSPVPYADTVVATRGHTNGRFIRTGSASSATTPWQLAQIGGGEGNDDFPPPPLTDTNSYLSETANELLSEIRDALKQFDLNLPNRSFAVKLAYQRDVLGRISAQTQTIMGVTNEHQYEYDLMGRLITHKKDNQTTRWTYDANGNRLTENGSTIAAYDSEDRLIHFKNNTYTYNAAGDLNSKTAPAGTTNYTYDSLGNLTRVNLPDGRQIDYLIDPENRRIGKRVDSELQYGLIYQDGLRPIAEIKPNGGIRSVFLYAEKGNVPSVMIRGERAYRIISDHLGSVRLVIDTASNVIVQQLDYDVWGAVINDTYPGFQPFGFAGGLYDPDTKLTRFGARDYDAETGRWTAKDPILFAGGGANLYGYVSNDPVNYFDPSGLAKQISLGVSGLIQAGFPQFAFLGSGLGGGASLGISIPKNWKNWKCYQFFAQSQLNIYGGIGAFAGIGLAVGVTSSQGPIKSGSSTGITSEINAGWNAAAGAGVTIEGDFSTAEAWKNQNPDLGVTAAILPKLGVGWGLAGGVGTYNSTRYATPTGGDDCECQ